MVKVKRKIKKRMLEDLSNYQKQCGEWYLDRVKKGKLVPRGMYYKEYTKKELKESLNNTLKHLPNEFIDNINEYYSGTLLTSIYCKGLTIEYLCKKHSFIEAIGIMQCVSRGLFSAIDYLCEE